MTQAEYVRPDWARWEPVRIREETRNGVPGFVVTSDPGELYATERWMSRELFCELYLPRGKFESANLNRQKKLDLRHLTALVAKCGTWQMFSTQVDHETRVQFILGMIDLARLNRVSIEMDRGMNVVLRVRPEMIGRLIETINELER